MIERALFVEDEPAVLDGYKRVLGRELAIDTAEEEAKGLTAIAKTDLLLLWSWTCECQE